MSDKIDIDLVALQDFISALKSFNSDLEAKWGGLQSRWQATSESWRDRKKDQFQDDIGWDEVIRTMQNYLQTSETHEAYLIRLYERGREVLDS